MRYSPIAAAREFNREMLAQSQAFTERKRREKAEARALEVLIKELGQYGWIGKHAEEMAAAHLRVTR